LHPTAPYNNHLTLHSALSNFSMSSPSIEVCLVALGIRLPTLATSRMSIS